MKHYERFDDYFGEVHREQKEKLRKTNRSLAILYWAVAIILTGAMAFFIWALMQGVK